MRTRHLLTGLVTASLILAACGSDDDSADTATTDAAAPAATDAAASEATTGDAGGATTAAPASDAPAGTTGDATAAGAATVMVATDPELGDYLVDGSGMTLYLFTQDDGTTTACTGGCAENWPPIIAEGDPTGGDGIDAALLGTADGIEPNQVTYNGHLLYYFHEDTAPGDTNGVGLPDWFAVDPAGEAIEAG
jgi:predicted lipoprotein with Yx(FWY)xxD motif